LRSLPAPEGGTLTVEALQEFASEAEIDLTQRAEDLSIGQFARFASVLGAAGSTA